VSGASLGNKDKYAVRGQLEWDPAENLNFRLNVHVAEDKSDETGLHLMQPYTPYNGGAGGPVIPADTSRYVTGWSLDPAFAKAVGLMPTPSRARQLERRRGPSRPTSIWGARRSPASPLTTE
jgi:iron complex outermembrane receptor protein